MNAILKKLVEIANAWPPEEQAELVEYARAIEARRIGIYELDAEELAAVEEGIGQAERGEFVEDDAIRRLARRFGA